MGGEWRTILVGLLGYGGQGLYALDVTEPEEPIFLWAVENNIVTPDGSSALGADSRKIHYWKKSRNPRWFAYAPRRGREWQLPGSYRTLSTPSWQCRRVVDGPGLWATGGSRSGQRPPERRQPRQERRLRSTSSEGPRNPPRTQVATTPQARQPPVTSRPEHGRRLWTTRRGYRRQCLLLEVRPDNWAPPQGLPGPGR